MEKKEDTLTSAPEVETQKIHAYCNDQTNYQWKMTENDNFIPFSGLTVLNKELMDKTALDKEFISFEEFDEIGGSIVQKNISKVE